MKTISAALTTALANRYNTFWLTKLFTFTLFDGTILRFCSGSLDVTIGGVTWLCGRTAGGPFFEKADKKAKVQWGVGAKGYSMIFDVVPGLSTVEGMPWQFAASIGLFDNADFFCEYLLGRSPGDTSLGKVLAFSGWVSNLDWAPDAMQFTCATYLDLLDRPMPCNVQQAGCLNTLFDQTCTLSPASFVVAGSVSGALSISAYTFGVTPTNASGYFNLGKLTFTSGKNNGQTRDVQGYQNGSPSQVQMFPPFGFAPLAGDTFNIFPGCDKTFNTCTNTFANQVHFRGFDQTPQWETAL